MYNIGKTIICKNDEIYHLTINKSYTIIEIDEHGIKISDDDDKLLWFNFKDESISYRIINTYFYNKTEIRKFKLNSLNHV
ncbi:hypothetical protein M0Q50_07410 [bacterium]|jgi:hypothetical protein|nr:hypothetical protein [bacterium]